jgi:hypothetical protein
MTTQPRIVAYVNEDAGVGPRGSSDGLLASDSLESFAAWHGLTHLAGRGYDGAVLSYPCGGRPERADIRIDGLQQAAFDDRFPIGFWSEWSANRAVTATSLYVDQVGVYVGFIPGEHRATTPKAAADYVRRVLGWIPTALPKIPDRSGVRRAFPIIDSAAANEHPDTARIVRACVERWGVCGIEAAPDRGNPASARLLSELADLGDRVEVFSLIDNARHAGWLAPRTDGIEGYAKPPLPTTVFWNNRIDGIDANGNKTLPSRAEARAAGCSLAVPPWAYVCPESVDALRR